MKKYLLMALFFLCGIALTSTADAATITVCASGCDQTTVSMALGAANEGDTVQVQGGGASPYDGVGETFGTPFPAASVTLQCTDGATISQTDPTGGNTFVLTTSSTVTGCTFGNISLTTASSAYTSGIVITGNTFTQGTTGTIDFLDGHVAYAEITDNSNIRWLRSTASSTNMLISGNTFYGDKPIAEDEARGTVLGLVGTSTMPTIQNNTFLMGYDASETVATEAAFIYLYGAGGTFATNTVRVISASSPEDLEKSVDLRVTGGAFTFSGNTLQSPLHSMSGGMCQVVNIQPGLEIAMTPSFSFTNNTFKSNCNGTGDGVKVSSIGIGSETMEATFVFTRNLFFGDDSSGGAVVFNDLSSPSSGEATFVKNGRYGIQGPTENMDILITTDTWKTNNPLLREGDVDTTNNMQVVPFSDYLDIDGTTDDIGAWLGTRRSTIYLDDNGTVDYSTIDVNPGGLSRVISNGLRSGDTIQMAAGTYDSIFISSERATTTVSIIGAGPSTIIDPSGSSLALYISGMTNATVSDLTIQGADSVSENVKLRHMLFSYGGNDYDDGMSSANSGGSPFPPEWGLPAPMLIIQNDCSWIDGTSWDASLAGVLGTPPLNVHIVLGTTNRGREYGTFVVPKEAFADQAAFATGCPAVSVDAFIEDAFVYNPATGDYAYDESAITSAGATLMAGLASTPDLDRQLEYYAGLFLSGDVTSSTFSDLVISGNGYGVQFGADFFGGALGDQFYTAHGNVIRNSVFTANIQDDVLTDSSGQNILSNSSFDRTAVNVSQAGGSMLVKYDARVRTLKGSDGSTAVSSVVTSFTDGLGTETAGGSTSSGYTNYTSLPAHTITNASNALTTGGYNAYTVETEALSGYTASSTSAILSEPNQTVTIYLVSEEANAPGAPTITALSGTTASIGVDENSNGGTVEYTLYNSTSASYVAADGSASATAAWQTAANWEAATISGLTCNTAYSFVMNARNALGDVTATSSAGVVTTSACSSGGGGGGGGGDGSSGGGGGGSSGGGATSAGPGAFYVPLPIGSTPPVSTEPVLPPVVAPAPETPSTPAPITEVPTAPTAPASNQARTQVSSDATSFRVTLAPQDQERLASFIDAGTTPATQALGSGERRALVRDALDTMGRAPTQTDLERLAQGQIPQTRNLTREREQLPRARSTFRTIYGRDPNFQNPEENLAWNTLMYRIRFTRDLAEERQGITTFRQTFRRAPSDPFQWAVVRVLGYVR